MNHTARLRLALALLAISGAAASAAPSTFDFQDPKGVNNVRFSLDAPLEAITGTANGVSGRVHYDPAAPEATTGRIVLSAASLTVSNPLMREHLHGADWLDVAAHPEITFTADHLSNIRAEADRVTADVTGKLTVKGVTREITAPVTFTHLPDKLGARLGDQTVEGDLLVMRAGFTINRSEFNIMPGLATDKVAETIHLDLAIAGAAKK